MILRGEERENTPVKGLERKPPSRPLDLFFSVWDDGFKTGERSRHNLEVDA